MEANNTENNLSQMDQFQQLEQWPIEDIQPLEVQVQIAEEEASLWVKRNIMKLSKQFGVHFQGFEEEVWSLLLKLDKKKMGKTQ